MVALAAGSSGRSTEISCQTKITTVMFITVVIFCWRDCLISESMGHHDSEIMDDGGID
jgi:hypothetical protein